MCAVAGEIGPYLAKASENQHFIICRINDWTILHTFKVTRTKSQASVKKHITRLAWGGDNIFGVSLLDQNFNLINKDF